LHIPEENTQRLRSTLQSTLEAFSHHDSNFQTKLDAKASESQNPAQIAPFAAVNFVNRALSSRDPLSQDDLTETLWMGLFHNAVMCAAKSAVTVDDYKTPNIADYLREHNLLQTRPGDTYTAPSSDSQLTQIFTTISRSVPRNNGDTVGGTLTINDRTYGIVITRNGDNFSYQFFNPYGSESAPQAYLQTETPINDISSIATYINNNVLPNSGGRITVSFTPLKLDSSAAASSDR
jgi:hypothetical protein